MRLPRGPGSIALAVGLVLVVPALAAGQGDTLDLRWSAPAGCPSEATVRARIEALSSGLHRRAEVLVEARVERLPGGRFALAVRTERGGHAGARDLEAEECETPADVVVLLSALLLDPQVELREALAGAPAAPPAPAGPLLAATAPPDGGARPEESAAAPMVREPASPPRLRLALAGGAFGEVGTLPGPTLGFSGALLLRYGPFEGRIAPHASLPRSARLQGAGDAGASVLRLGSLLEGCWVVLEGVIQIAPCVGLDGGAMRGRSFGVDRPTRGWTAFFAPEVAGRAELALTDTLRLGASVALFVPLRRATFEIEGLGRVHRSAPLYGRVALELRVLLL